MLSETLLLYTLIYFHLKTWNKEVFLKFLSSFEDRVKYFINNIKISQPQIFNLDLSRDKLLIYVIKIYVIFNIVNCRFSFLLLPLISLILQFFTSPENVNLQKCINFCKKKKCYVNQNSYLTSYCLLCYHPFQLSSNNQQHQRLPPLCHHPFSF